MARWTFHTLPMLPQVVYDLILKSNKIATSIFSSVVSVTGSQLQGLQFKPELRLLSLHSFICSSCVCMGFLWVFLFLPLLFRWIDCAKCSTVVKWLALLPNSKKDSVFKPAGWMELSTLNCPNVWMVVFLCVSSVIDWHPSQGVPCLLAEVT